MDRLLSALRRHSSDLDARNAQPRCALVTSVDADSHTCRVTIQPEGVLSGWIPVPAMGVGGVAIVSPPSVGDQVFVNFQEGDHEHPIVVGRLFSAADLPPTSSATGRSVQSGELGIFADGAWIHIAGGVVHAQASKFQIKGDVELDGKLTATGDIIAGTVSLQQHVQTGVKAGQDISGPPKA